MSPFAQYLRHTDMCLYPGDDQGYLWFQVKFGEAVEECLIAYV